MYKKLFLTLCVIGCIGVLFFPGCTTAETPTYTLTATLSDGVTGTPAAGTATYNENDTVSYSYTAQSGYANLQVTLDGAPAAASGTVTMNANHTLNVSAIVDVRGKWTGLFTHQGDSTYFEVTFSDGIASGTTRGLFDWQPGYANGTFTVSGNQIDFDLRRSVGAIDIILACTGTFSNANNMSGDWIYTIVNYDSVEGTWTLVRD